MSTGVEFEEDPILTRKTFQPVVSVQNANLNNYQNFFVNKTSQAKTGFGSASDKNWVVRLVLRSRIVKTEVQAEIVIIVAIVIMCLLSIYFFTKTFSQGQIQTIRINNVSK
jgi:hypothetical protein